ncbi:MAG: hypothetical protein A3E83_01695 [Gammaproteobacteria bacterium RIFCSPHIGHO2_12_FULL_41_20]|nr:MAG: hypothetical protein A3E83_01695 [Gammaproteobacteria bacterium RIFCSPHIGHO2_12_FULL_41_20]
MWSLLKKDPRTILRKIIVGKTVKKDENLKKTKNLDLIKRVIKQGLSGCKSLAEMYREIATFLVNIGQPELAQRYYKLSLELDYTPATYSLYLQCLLLSPSCSDQEMFLKATQYNQFFSDIKKSESLPLSPVIKDKKLNIGYICHFFHNSVSPSLLLPFIRAHNRERVKIFCYSDTESFEVPENIKNIADTWRDTKNLDDDQLTTVIRQDKIDVLLELNGHCVTNRYGVIARRAAPIQISYYNINATTGISEMDYILVGDEICLDQSRDYYTEKFYYLKGVTSIAEFPTTFPKCSPPPSLHTTDVTFGSFGAAHKVNYQVIKVWCKILKQVPHAKFYMKAGVLTHDNYLQAYKRSFAAEGVDLSRIHLEGFSDHLAMLDCYAKIDIALDTFPHTGGTTTVEALWQGVPVITWSGDRYAWKHGKMILTSVGHPELVAYSEEEYIAKAVELANSKERLLNYRNQLRADFKNSPKADVKAFATKLEDAYYDMWKNYEEYPL